MIEKTTKFRNIIIDITHNLNNINYDGDLGDIGNEIGVNIGKYIVNDKIGFEFNDFINGLKHGISLTNGTH